MAGPWEKYAAAPAAAAQVASNPEAAVAGPWSKYQGAATPAADFSGVTSAVDSTAAGRQADGWQAGTGRDLAFGARSVLQGAGSLLGALGGDALGALETKITGRPVGSFRDNAGRLADALGLPKAQTGGDRVLGDIGEALTGTGLTLGLGGALNAGRSAVAAPSARTAAADFLTAQPALQVASTVGGSAAAGGTREAGGGAGAQLVAALAGGLAPGVVPRLPTSGVLPALAANTTRRVMRGRDAEGINRTLGEFAEAGVQPSVGQATGNRVLQATETLLGSVPGSAGVIDRFAQGQAGQFGRRIDDIASSLTPGREGVDPEMAGIAIRQGIGGPGGFKDVSRERSNALYRQLDALLPQDERVGIDNVRAALSSLNEEIPGAPSVSRFFQNARLEGIETALAKDAGGIEGVLSRPGMRERVDQMRADLTQQAALRRAELAEQTNVQRQELTTAAGDQRAQLQSEADQVRNRLANMIEERRTALYQEADDQMAALYAEQHRATVENERRRMLNMTNLEPVLTDAEIRARVPSRAQIDSRLPRPDEIDAQLPTTGDIDSQVMSPAAIEQRLTPDSAIADGNFGNEYVEQQINEFLTGQIDGKLPYEALQKLRSLVGREIDNSNFASDVPRSKWRAVYGALSRDMEAAVAGNPEATSALQNANRHHADYINKLENLDSIIAKKDGEGAFIAAISGVKEGPTRLRAVMEAIPEADRKIVTSAFIRRMGRAVGSQQNDDSSVFSMNTFLTNYANMSPAARKVMFDGYGPEFSRNMETIAKATSRIRDGSKVFANPSGTGGRVALVGQVAGTAGTAGASLAMGNAAGAFLAVGGSLIGAGIANAAARLMTSPKYVNWLARTSEKPAGELVSQLQVLRGIAERSRDQEMVEMAEKATAEVTAGATGQTQ